MGEFGVRISELNADLIAEDVIASSIEIKNSDFKEVFGSAQKKFSHCAREKWILQIFKSRKPSF